MTLNVAKAITYNKSLNYSQPVIGTIQSRVQAQTTGTWDTQSVKAIAKWQASAIRPMAHVKLDADGMMGPSTLGVLIAEAMQTGREQEASTLRQYPYKLPSGGGSLDPIIKFSHWTSIDLALRPDAGGTRWQMRGRFHITLKLDPNLPDFARYEYRQRIKGTATIQAGKLSGTPADKLSDRVWTKTNEPFDMSGQFAVPPGYETGPYGGLIYKPKGILTEWKEDGEVVNNKAFKFGYRAGGAVIAEGIVDSYSPNQQGPDYVLQDTFGTMGAYLAAAKISVELWYQGYVLDTQTNVQLGLKGWHYKATGIVSW